MPANEANGPIEREAPILTITNPCPERAFPHCELPRRQRLARPLAPNAAIFLIPALLMQSVGALLPLFPGQNRLGRDAVPAPPGLLLLAAAFGPFGVGEVEPGSPALDPVGGPLDAVMALGAVGRLGATGVATRVSLRGVSSDGPRRRWEVGLRVGTLGFRAARMFILIFHYMSQRMWM